MDSQKVAELVKKLAEDQETAFKAYEELETMATRASAEESSRKEAAAALAATLPDQLKNIQETRGKQRDMYTPQQLVQRCENTMRVMAYVADGAQVPVLTEAIGIYDVREMARWALDRNTSDQATVALINALDEVGPRFRVGVVGALSTREGAAVKSALKKAALDPEREVSMAAVDALSNFADASHDDVICKAAEKSNCRQCREAAMKARIRLAETLCGAGKHDEARKIYKAVAKSDAPQAQKNAAELAMQKGH